MHVHVVITEADGAKMTAQQWEMLDDAGFLIQAALRGDTAPKFLRSFGAMSHSEEDSP